MRDLDARNAGRSLPIRYPDPHHPPPGGAEAGLPYAGKAIAAIEEQATTAWASGRRAVAAEDLMVVDIPTHEA